MLKETLSPKPRQTLPCPETDQQRASALPLLPFLDWRESRNTLDVLCIKTGRQAGCDVSYPRHKQKICQHEFLGVTGMITDLLKRVFLHTSSFPTCPALFLARRFCLPFVSIAVSCRKHTFVIHPVTIMHGFNFQGTCSPSDFCCIALILLVILVMRLISCGFHCQIFYRYLWLLQLYLLCLAPFNQPPESFKGLKFSLLKFITAACP